MTAFLIDEMFPAAAAILLQDKYSHDAVHVTEAGRRFPPALLACSCPLRSARRGAPDTQVAAAARAEARAVVTENVADFSAERDIVLVFVLKKNLPAGSAQAPALAAVLDGWNHDHPNPYLGPHWPRTD